MINNSIFENPHQPNLMNQAFKRILTNARHDVKLVLDVPVPDQLFVDLGSLLEHGIAITLIIDSKWEEPLRSDLFLFNKCLRLLKKGGQVYLHDSLDGNLIIGDYYQCLHATQKDKIEINDSKDDQVVKHIQIFEQLKKTAIPLLENEDDIQILFETTEATLLKGDEVKLTWEVKNAETIAIEGIGEVDAIGSQKVKPKGHTIFKLGAYNKYQSALRTVGIKVYDDIVLEYDLSFANPRNRKFSSLVKEENYPHVFGVAKGNILKLTWSVKESIDVYVSPFEIYATSGTHEFVPNKNMTITIVARVFDRTVVRKIQILVFPIRLFNEKLLEPLAKVPMDIFRPSLGLSEVYMQLGDSTFGYPASLLEVKKRSLERYNELLQLLENTGDDTSQHHFDLEAVNHKVYTRLKKYYGKQPKMTKVIESLKSLYGKR